jgi:hypothetical protein
MAAPQGTVVSGAACRKRLGRTGHQPRRHPAPWRYIERLHSGVAGLQGRLILQAGGALRATRIKPFPTSKAVPRWQPYSSNYRGNGGTHEAWQAASNKLILLCIRLNFDLQSSSFACQTVPYIYGRLPSSLAAHEEQRRQYQYPTSVLAGFTAVATNRDAFRAP